MRFLHLADLHIGKMFNDVSMLEDQRSVLMDQIIETAKERDVEAVLIAGDVYQRSTPQAGAMELFSRFVSELVGMDKKVFIISGNHDSAQRISYFSPLLKKAGVYVSEAFEGTMQSVTLQDEYGDIVIWLLPYMYPRQVKRYLPEEKIVTYQDAVRAVLKNTPVDTRKRNILICHQFITGSETSDSEVRSVGGADNVDASLFDDFDYVALGHIHKPQKIGRETLRYAGSPLKYSFSEENHKKSVAVIDVKEKENIEIEKVPVQQIHDVRKVDGVMDDILRMPYSEDYVWVTVHDEDPSPDARLALRVVFPNIMKFSVVNSKTKLDMDVSVNDNMENKSIIELFSDFYRLRNNGRDPEEKHLYTIRKMLKQLEEEQ